jgi:hypothetical protein
MARYAHRLSRLAPSQSVRLEDDVDLAIVLVLRDNADVEATGALARLGPGDALILRAPAAGAIRVMPMGEAEAYLVVLRKLAPA